MESPHHYPLPPSVNQRPHKKEERKPDPQIAAQNRPSPGKRTRRKPQLIMHAVQKPNTHEADWLITYADIVSILLAFFILLFSVTEVQQAKFEALQESLDKTIFKKKEKEAPNPLLELQNALTNVLDQHAIDPIKTLSLTNNMLKLDLPGELLFATASTNIGPESTRLINDLAQQIKAYPFQNYTIEIEGHTDDVPISNERFPSNWQLSTGRAISVLELFAQAGINQEQLKAIGYADSRPKLPNRDANGVAITRNQQQNRRVEIVVTRITQ